MTGFLRQLLVLVVMNLCFDQLPADESPASCTPKQTPAKNSRFNQPASEEPVPGKQVMQSLTSPALPGEKLGYLLFLPKDYGKEDRKWPVMLFLHGSGERGDDLKLVKVHGPPKLVEAQPDFPFIVVSPQCPKELWWPGDLAQRWLDELLDHVLTRFAADPQRVVVTGLSMGGFGSWTLTARHPGRFAAAVPICGGGDPDDAPQLKSVPFWIFHGAKDAGVPLKLSEEMLLAVTRAGGQAKLTVYPEAGHDSWTETYNNPAVYEWLLAQRRADPAPLPTAKPDQAFAKLGLLDFAITSKVSKDSFSAMLVFGTSSANAARLREQLDAGGREKLLKESLSWAVAQPLESLLGTAGREKTRAAVTDLCRSMLLDGKSDIPVEVLIDLYFVRHNDRLRLEAK
jgi:poly(3-hydroxybutyrate) depolymerase